MFPAPTPAAEVDGARRAVEATRRDPSHDQSDHRRRRRRGDGRDRHDHVPARRRRQGEDRAAGPLPRSAPPARTRGDGSSRVAPGCPLRCRARRGATPSGCVRWRRCPTTCGPNFAWTGDLVSARTNCSASAAPHSSYVGRERTHRSSRHHFHHRVLVSCGKRHRGDHGIGNVVGHHETRCGEAGSCGTTARWRPSRDRSPSRGWRSRYRSSRRSAG